MTKRFVLGAVFLAIGVLASVSCRRSDMRIVTIDVPQAGGARDIRIVTNAALDEVIGQYDGIKNQFEIDLAKGLVFYHESQRLLSPEYQRRIEARIAEVGFRARVQTAKLNPPALVPTKDGPVQMWPNRYTAVISVPEMKSMTGANIVVDAIAFARIGGDSPRVTFESGTRRLLVRYESLCLALRNIEYAIACAGYDANVVPARLGRPEASPHGWTAAQL